MTSAEKLYSIGCGDAMVQSQIDRGNIQAAISNTNTGISYMKKCYAYFKETGEAHWLESGANWLTPYYNNLLSVEHLAQTYHALYGEKFYKAKLTAEKLLTKAQTKDNG